MLVTDEYPIQDKLGDRGVREILQGFIPADVSDEFQALHVDKGLNKPAV